MMKSLSLLPLLAALFAGCMASNALTYESKATTNQYHLAMVRKGMSEKQVLQIMHKPYSYETFVANDDIYDVWFYVTKPTGLDQTRMVSQNLTPLTFKNGILVGTGYNWYYYAMKVQAMELEPQKPKPVSHEKQQTIEDKSFEKALRAPGKPRPEDLQKAHQKTKATAKHSSEGKIPAHQKTKAKENPNENLPSNVHIISEAEAPASCDTCLDYNEQSIEYRSEEPMYCGNCSRAECSPDRFTALINGMTELQIYKAFGAPLRYETFEYEGNAYDVWFYETYPSKSPSVVPQEMTILTFKDAILISKSDDAFYELKAQVEEQKNSAQKQVARKGPPKFIKPYVMAQRQSVTVKQFSKVRMGMNPTEVEKQLGAPTDREKYVVDDDEYEAWFYQVDSKNNGKYIPVTFKNGSVIGITMQTYNDVRKSANHECIDCYTPDADRMVDEADDQNFNYW